MHLEHIGIYSKNPAALSEWYGEVLGFTVVRTLKKEGRPPIFFMKGETGVVIEILPTSSTQQKRELSDPGYSHIGIVVEDFDRAASTLQSKGIEPHDIRTTSNGWTIGYFEDPEGNRLEIVYRPKEE